MTDEAYATPLVVHGVARVVTVIPPLLVTMTRLPSSTAATWACVAIGRGLLTCATACHAPPDSGRRLKVPRLPHPPCCWQSAVSASTWPSITSSDRIEPPGLAAAVQCAPPSVVSHSPLPKTNPCDGGAHWAAAASPGGSIMSLEVIDGQVLALMADCRSQAGCGGLGTLTRRPLSGGAWHEVMQVRYPRPIATQARVAAALDGSRVVVTSDGGITVTTRATPCTTQGVAYASSVAVTSPYGLALLCIGQGYTGHTDKIVYISGDLGAHWARAGAPPSDGDPFAIAAGTPASLVVAAASGASWLFYSADGAQWRDAYVAGDGGLGWNDLGFTSTTNGVAVHGPVLTDSNAERRPGQLLLTSDGGASWTQVRF